MRELYFKVVYTSLIQLFSNGTAEMKLAMLALLKYGAFVKTLLALQNDETESESETETDSTCSRSHLHGTLFR